ncbi:MAG TPA: PHP domain-containing protein [Streptosporangiaceae bacterium]|nr:PHP domain-containing protein [Streptosporangiaceae bacterium]
MALIRVDCHLHTALSGDAVTTIDELAERVEQERLDVVFITDHNVTAAAVEAAERGIGARVIVGEEIRTTDGDVIGLFLTERIPYVLPLAEAIGKIRERGGLIYLPHPYDPGRSTIKPAISERLCAEGIADVVEVFNAKIEDQEHNVQAAKLAARYDLPGGAGSDAHDPEGIGAAYLEMPDFDGPADFLAALRQATITGEHRPHAVRYARRAPR